MIDVTRVPRDSRIRCRSLALRDSATASHYGLLLHVSRLHPLIANVLVWVVLVTYIAVVFVGHGSAVHLVHPDASPTADFPGCLAHGYVARWTSLLARGPTRQPRPSLDGSSHRWPCAAAARGDAAVIRAAPDWSRTGGSGTSLAIHPSPLTTKISPLLSQCQQPLPLRHRVSVGGHDLEVGAAAWSAPKQRRSLLVTPGQQRFRGS